jgi:hypothetical protein
MSDNEVVVLWTKGQFQVHLCVSQEEVHLHEILLPKTRSRAS